MFGPNRDPNGVLDNEEADDGLSSPEQTWEEDLIENEQPEPGQHWGWIGGDNAKPGKILAVNDDDTDADNIPDFADGFDGDDTDATGDEYTDGEVFAEYLVKVTQAADPAVAQLRFTYLASDPAGVQRTQQGPYTVYEPAPGGGDLRLWSEPGDESRRCEMPSVGHDVAAEV